MPIAYFNRRHSRRRPKHWQARSLNSGRGHQGLLVRLLITGILSLAVLAAGMLAWVSRDLPTAEGIVRRTVPQSTKIYDRTGEHLLYDIHGEEKRTSVELDNIPDNLINATLAAEDRTFYEHKGFRFTSMVRSLIVNFIKGGKVQGGSTITQQFIKNAIFTNEKLYTRKIKELILAYQIERKFSKDEILKLYFNEIPYGSNAYGAEAAAQTFFGKSVKGLDLAQSALLAALPKGTTYYSPYGSHIDELIGRQQYILDTMASLGYITQAEAEAAKKVELNFKARQETITAPHFVFYIREQLAAKYGDRAVEQGGLKIITTLDIDKQKIAEEAVNKYSQANERLNASNASLVAIDVKTGEVLAMVGSKDYFNDDIAGQVNVALRPRQPGSSFKPIAYATALSLGFTPETVIFDVNTVFKTDTKDYDPKNYNLKEHGPVTFRQALAGSLNIPAVKVLYLAGIDRVLDLAKKFGYTTLNDRSRFGLSLVLGGAEVKLLEHTAAYATLAREGVAKQAISVLRVEDARGNILEEVKEARGTKILEPQTTREITSILSDNAARSYIFGEQNYLTLPNRPVAAKTGTTNDYKDAWTMGYTPQIAAGVWVGNSNNKEMSRGADGSVVAAPIWRYFMNHALAIYPALAFTAPEQRLENKPILNGQMGGTVVEIDHASGLLATDLTPMSYRENKVYEQYHTILKYLTPGDPLGPAPENPEADPQYANWESSIRRWATEHNLQDELPPTEYDNLHVAGNRPQISISSPTNNSTVNSNPATLSVLVSAPRSLSRVVYFLDDQEIGTANRLPWNLNFSFTSDWQNGFHTLRAVAYDDIDNTNEASVNFNLLVNLIPSNSTVKFINLNNGQKLTLTEFPYTLNLEFTDSKNIKQVDFYLSEQNQPSFWLGVITSPKTFESFLLQNTKAGKYTLSVVITSQNNQILSGPKTTFTINN